MRMNLKRNVLELLGATVQRTPDRTALIDGDTRWSFAQLNDAARAAASAILEHTHPNGFVGVLCDRQAIGVVGMLAALWAGCCYVPLDVKMPDMDGIETLQQAKQIAPDTEVIMLTGHASMEFGMKGIICTVRFFTKKWIRVIRADA